MSDAEKQEEREVEKAEANGYFWPDETVDALAGLAVITLLVVMALWYVIS